jgi:hypothetical protein
MNVKPSRLFPGERENEPLVLDDLAIDAAEPVLVDLYLGTGEIRRAHPALHVFRLDQSAKTSDAGASKVCVMRSSSSANLALTCASP